MKRAQPSLEKYAHELDQILNKIDKIEKKAEKQTWLDKKQYEKLNKRAKHIQIIILNTKKRMTEEENRAFQQKIIDEKTIRNLKIQTIMDNLEIFEIKDDNGVPINTRQQLEQQTTEWLTNIANKTDQQLAEIVGEKE